MIEIAPEEHRKFELTWDEARMYCFALSVDGKSGWRLPTVDELQSIDWGIKYKQSKSVWVWTLDDYNDYCAQVDLIDGGVEFFNKKDNYVWVYPVRDLTDD